jgi:molybdopterin converting factor subunit 1
MTVFVQYFAILREQRGLADETIGTGASTPAGLYEELRARHGFTLPTGRIRVAVNGDFVPDSAPLHDGDTVVFIPPVAGG